MSKYMCQHQQTSTDRKIEASLTVADMRLTQVDVKVSLTDRRHKA
jgi:hypothetical protein